MPERCSALLAMSLVLSAGCTNSGEPNGLPRADRSAQTAFGEGRESPQTPSAAASASPSGPPATPQADAASGIPPETTTALTPPPPGDHWRLTRTPSGYDSAVIADYSSADMRIVQYHPNNGGGPGQRISVAVTHHTIDDVIDGYERVGQTTVRGGRPATHFRIGHGAGARQALVWDEGGVRVAVYAYADLRQLRALAEQTEPCDSAAC